MTTPATFTRIVIDDHCDLCGPAEGRIGIVLRKNMSTPTATTTTVVCGPCLFELVGVAQADSPLTVSETAAGVRELMALRGSFGRAANGQDPNTIVTAIGLLLSDLIHHIATLKGLASEDRDYYIDLAEALWRNLGDWVRRAREGDKPA